MTTSSWLSWPNSRSGARHAKRPNSAARLEKARFTVEPLEARELLASYTAASVSALIADINAANTNGGTNTITLSAPTTSPYSLTARNSGTAATGWNGLPVIAANNNLTIVGNGDTIEKGETENGLRLFDVAPAASLTLQNLTLNRGWATATEVGFSAGGAIYNAGALTLSDVIVLDNEASPGSGASLGGGIWSDGSLILENGTLLKGNDCLNSIQPAQAALGGAVYIAGGTANITNTRFTANTVYGVDNFVGTAFGGALYVAAGQINITNTTVTNNRQMADGGGGGGIYIAGGTVTLTSDMVESNSSMASCGGVYIAGGTVTLTSDTVESNSTSDSGVGFGGGIYITGGTVTLTSDTVESNSTYGYGGGIYIAGGTVTLTSDTVESNSTYGYGGGIYIATGATVYLDEFTVANTINNTDESGLNGSTANIDGTYTLS